MDFQDAQRSSRQNKSNEDVISQSGNRVLIHTKSKASLQGSWYWACFYEQTFVSGFEVLCLWMTWKND